MFVENVSLRDLRFYGSIEISKHTSTWICTFYGLISSKCSFFIIKSPTIFIFSMFNFIFVINRQRILRSSSLYKETLRYLCWIRLLNSYSNLLPTFSISFSEVMNMFERAILLRAMSFLNITLVSKRYSVASMEPKAKDIASRIRYLLTTLPRLKRGRCLATVSIFLILI